MSAMERFTSLDETIKTIREEHDAAIKALSDKLLASNIELELTKKALADALADRQSAERLAVKLITQFDTVAKVFAEAQTLAKQVMELPNPKAEAAVAAAVAPPPQSAPVTVPVPEFLAPQVPA